jgi:hypothetical protein
MKRLEKPIKNAGIIKIDVDPKTYEEFKKNLFTALRKFGSGKKTRAVHKIIDKNLVHTAIFSGAAANSLGAPSRKDTNLNGILLNVYHFDDTLSGKGSVTFASELIDIEKKLKKEETFVNEARLHNIEKLQEKQKEIQDKYLQSFDYIKMIDGIYFIWLLTLSDVAVMEDSAGKPKIITVASDILADVLKKLYLQVHNKIEGDEHQLFEAIAIYFIKMYFYGESATYALNSMKKGFKEEIMDALEKAKVNKISEFNDISKLLRNTELLAITENTFDLQMQRFFGKLGYEEYVKPALVPFLAFMANLANPNQLFKDAYPINEDSHEILEELLLNEQKKITLQEKQF